LFLQAQGLPAWRGIEPVRGQSACAGERGRNGERCDGQIGGDGPDQAGGRRSAPVWPRACRCWIR